MILVSDSGSTKCDWVLVDKDGSTVNTSTIGFNPFFHSTEEVRSELTLNSVLMEHKDAVEYVFFYGAGCSHPSRNKIISDAILAVFPNVRECVVDHDLTGAAIASCGDSEGIACILGTGSNSCYYNGESVFEATPALGFILGDEGSGSYFGKQLLADWLYERMPSDIQKEFGDAYNLNKEEIFDMVYRKPRANVYLASFMKFVSERKSHPYFKQLIYTGLARFIATHVWCYQNFREVPVHFVGSIAYYFREVLEEVAFNHKFTVGKIVKRPREELAKYHYSQVYSKNDD